MSLPKVTTPALGKDIMREEDENMKKKYSRAAVIALLLVLLGGGFWLWNADQGLRLDEDQSAGSLDGMTDAQLQELMDQKVDEGSLMISINTQPEYPDGKSAGTIRIENSAQNNYLMVVKLYLRENGKDGALIYESGAIKPGYKIEKAKLLKNLKKGTYPVIAYFEGYDRESKEFIGKAASELNIVVRK